MNHAAAWARLARIAAPRLTKGAERLRVLRHLDDLIAYLHLLQGQGSGTGWDEGESIVAARHLGAIDEPVVVDCGANAGQWTTAVRDQLGHDRGRWLLVEPTAEFAQRLGGIANVDVLEAAAGEVDELRDLFVPDRPSGWMTLHERHDTFSRETSFHTRQVRVVRLDRALAERGIDRVDFLKMDVEGHELFVLRGLGDYLAERRVRALAFEFGAGNVNSRTFFRDFWDPLRSFGYRIERVAPGGATIPVHDYYETLEYFRGATNYVATCS
jgi:FkbM family methyltransferase